MKVALVHELLTIRGGAERVLRILTEMFPDAPIYTLLYDEKKLGDWFPKHRVRAAKLPTPYSLLPTPYRYNHHLYLKTFPKTVESWDFSEFDLVISTSSAFVHGIITNGKPKHLCIVNSPARYLWDRTHDVMQQRGLSAPIINLALSSIFHRLRIWDAEAADRPDMLLAASKEVQRRVELYWRRKSDVLYPPLDDGWLMKPLSTSERSDYFLIVSTLVPYKRIDLAIAACNALGKQLKIVGEGPDLQRLRKMAGTTIDRIKNCAIFTQAHAPFFSPVKKISVSSLWRQWPATHRSSPMAKEEHWKRSLMEKQASSSGSRPLILWEKPCSNRRAWHSIATTCGSTCNNFHVHVSSKS